MLASKLIGCNGGRMEYVGHRYSVISNPGDPIPLTGLTGGGDSEFKEGDLVFAWVCIAAVWPFSGATTSGWTFVGDISAWDTSPRTLALAYRLMGASPDATFEFDSNDLGATDCGCFGFRGVDQSTPLDSVTPQPAAFVNGAGPNPSAITTKSDGAGILAIASGVTASTAPADMHVLHYIGSSTLADVSIVAAQVDAEGTYNFGAWPDRDTATTLGKAQYTLAIRPQDAYRGVIF